MMTRSQNMSWKDVNSITNFTENTPSNKSKKAKKSPSILLASIQLMENFIKGIKNMNAYDAASTIISDANWIKKNSVDTFYDGNGNKVTIDIGKVYYIDYGKTFCGELSYYHYGLCVGKKDGKILIIPMRSGYGVFEHSYHPENNPRGNKKYRQGLEQEGFQKNCILMINDCRYISAGRIEKESVQIDSNIIESIQNQVFQVEFPSLYTKYFGFQKIIERNEKKITDQKQLIQKLKSENNTYKQLLDNIKKSN